MTPETWLPLLGLAIFVGAIFQSPWLVFLPLAIGVVVFVADFWRSRVLRNVNYKRQFVYRRGFPGETTPARIIVENNKRLPVSWLRARDLWPLDVAPQDENVMAPSHIPEMGTLVNLYNLRWNQQIIRNYTLKFQNRGVFQVGPVSLESGDLFGMFETQDVREDNDLLTVFPELIPLKEIMLPSRDPFGDIRTRRRIFEDPNLTIGIRQYHPEDDIRRIHWPASARTGELQVRLFQPVSARLMMVCLNVSTMEHSWLGTSTEALEHLVRLSATICYHGIEDGFSVGLISNGSLAHSDQPFRIGPGRTQEHLALLLQTLAGVTPFTSTPFDSYLLRAMPHVPMGATLVILTSIVSPQLRESIFTLKRYRPNILLMSISPDIPMDIPGVKIVHLPPNTERRAE